MKPVLTSLFVVLLTFATCAQDFGDGYFRLTSDYIGADRPLDVVNDANKDRLQFATKVGTSGQNWKITSVGGGFYRLTTQWLGEEKSLDVVQREDQSFAVLLRPTADVSGQFWKITRLRGGYFRLTTQYQGDQMSLDSALNGETAAVTFTKSGEFSGQFWRITPVGSNAGRTGFTRRNFNGFTVYVPNAKLNDLDVIFALRRIKSDLEGMEALLTEKQIERLKKVPVWIEYKRIEKSEMWYHKDPAWLKENGYPTELLKSVEISNITTYVDWEFEYKGLFLLHEFAHAYHDLYLDVLKAEITAAYKKAVASGKYDSVPFILGGKRRHYALDTEDEYFAELTEAYFNQNDYYPFNRAELEKFDPVGFDIVHRAWEEVE